MGSSTAGSDTMSLHAPVHPVPQLQGPFEESMVESINETVDRAKPDPVARRTMLLSGPTYERVCAGRWKQKPGEKFHPLWKITAQMSFGIHLLAEGLAKSEDDVMSILQTHVDDVDGFLESTTEDFDLAQSDVAERLRYLKLPLEHVEVFDRMLEDRAFRVSIVEGNEKIEHIMERTSEATKDALKDIQKGLQATTVLGKYLEKVNVSWRTRSPEHDAVFVAMVGNVEGWHLAFEELHTQGTKLGVLLVQLAGIVSEMQRRAGVVSRKTLLKQRERGQESPFRELHDRGNFAMKSPNTYRISPQVPAKPLPKAPGIVNPSKQIPQRISFQGSRSKGTSSANSQDKKALDKGDREGEAANKAHFGDDTRGLRNQKSAPDLEPRPEASNRVDVNSTSALGSLGRESGLGLGRIMETNSSRPVIVQRYSTQAGSGDGGTQHSQSNLPKEQSARVLHAPVPEQAPSHKKRLSFSLRNKSKGRQLDTQLNPALPKASGNRLKSALSSRRASPPTSADEPASIVSPALPASRSSPDNNYHDKSSGSSSPRIVTPISAQVTSTSTAAAKTPQSYAGHNPAFTSHPPNMEMAKSPSLKQEQTPEPPAVTLEVPSLRAVPDLVSGSTSYESSLGEPGPEVSAADEGDDTTQETPIAELESGSLAAQGLVVELEAAVPTPSQSTVFELEAPRQNQPGAPNKDARMSTLSPTVGATIQSHSDFFKLPPQQAGDQSGEQVNLEGTSAEASPPSARMDKAKTGLLHRSFQLPAAGQSTMTNLLSLNTEGPASCGSSQPPPNGKAVGTRLASLENPDSQVPMHIGSFELPADPETRKTSLELGTDGPHKAKQRRSFQLPPGGQVKDTSSTTSEEKEVQSDVHHKSFHLPTPSKQHGDAAKTNEVEQNDKRDSRGEDRQTLPSRLSMSEARPMSKRLSPKHPMNLIETISHTPPGSPIHERPTSSASFHSAANSARLTSYRASIDLAPPEEAPAPPAPGGRGMVNPDYAMAGAFEGERRPKRTSGTSMNGLKRMFSNGSSSSSRSRAGSVRVVEIPEGRTSKDGVHDNVDLMSPGGSHVLWFKGMSRDGVWVSGS